VIQNDVNVDQTVAELINPQFIEKIASK
jgi:hypothetical protein